MTTKALLLRSLIPSPTTKTLILTLSRISFLLHRHFTNTRIAQCLNGKSLHSSSPSTSKPPFPFLKAKGNHRSDQAPLSQDCTGTYLSVPTYLLSSREKGN